MTKEYLEKLKTLVKRREENAETIMEGDAEYDGADGARYVLELCGHCKDLIAEVERKQNGSGGNSEIG